MDASIVCVGLLVLCLEGLVTQTVPSVLPAQAQNITVVNDEVSPTGTAGMPCNTAKGVSGNCTVRQFCEYSTFAVDLSLYATKAYKQPCSERETCCPPSFQIQPTVDAKNSWDKNIFNDNDDDDFDDDDK